VLLSELTAPARRLALVGLAKNTGKTVALTALLEEHERAGRVVGVTSVGRDGEEHDVIDFRIEKPRVTLAPGSIVATTDELLRASGLRHELLERTAARTPLGRVLIARLSEAGSIEVAGPSAAGAVSEVSRRMLALGAQQALIDGAIDRRAASSPDVADGLVLSTGAVLSADIEAVVSRTSDAVALARLPNVQTDGEGARLRELAEQRGVSLLVDEDLNAVELPPRFVLTAEPPVIEHHLLGAAGTPRWLLVAGALPEGFVRALAVALRRRSRELGVIVADSTKVFLSERGLAWYERHGVRLHALRPLALLAITVNPLAPQSHRFDSERLCALLREAIPDVPVLDVLGPAYPRDPLGAYT
jgi:hypothetical protein